MKCTLLCKKRIKEGNFMSEIVTIILSAVVLILMGILATFLLILNESKEEIWNEICNKRNDKNMGD